MKSEEWFMKSGFKQKQFFLILLIALFLLQGCGSKDTKVILTTGFKKNEVFKIEKMSCSLSEILVYLTNTKNQYEEVYGKRIWEIKYEDILLEENIKETVLARIARIKAMNLLAKEKKITLSEEENKLLDIVAQSYFSSLNDVEIKKMDISLELIRSMYGEYALADKVYEYIIKDINPEISDDEARTITITHILIKTHTNDSQGNKIPYSTNGKKAAYTLAKEVWERAMSGESFDLLAETYNEDVRDTFSFGKGEVDDMLEEASFLLGTNEISKIVETENGFEIIKCLNTFNREETDLNKVKIVEKRKREVFNEEYETFVSGLTKNMNEKLWDDVGLIHDDEVSTTSFWQIYDEKYKNVITSTHE